MHRIILILAFTLAFTRADDITLRDGTVYKNAKVIGHDATTVTILYADGGATLPIAKLPDELQKKYGDDSEEAAAEPQSEADKSAEWKNYRQAQDKYVVVNGKLVPRNTASIVTLNVKLDHLADVKSASGESLGHGSLVDIYGGGTAVTTDPAALKPTGDSVFLKDYVLSPNGVVKIEAVKTGATETGGLYYIVAQPFSFEFWKKAGSPR